MKRVPRLALALLLLLGAGMAAGYGIGGMPARARQVEQPGVLPQERVFQSEAEERHFLRAEVSRVENKWAAADWRTGESFAIEADLRRLRARLEELEQRLVETDPVTAIKEHVAWLTQLPISEEEAATILGGSPAPPGSSLCLDTIPSSPQLVPLKRSYYRYDAMQSTPEPDDGQAVVQVWYRPGVLPLQYVVIRQQCARRYVRIQPHQWDGISFFPSQIAILEQGARVGLLHATRAEDGEPFAPAWIQGIWHAEWIARGIRHSIFAVNFSEGQLLRVVEELSGQQARVKRGP